MFEKFWANSPELNEKKNDVEKIFLSFTVCKIGKKKNG